MNILHLTSSRGFYGAERVIINLIRHLDPGQISACLADFLDERHPNDDLLREARRLGVRTFTLPCRKRLDRRAFGHLIDILKAHHFDLLHCHEIKSRFYGLPAAWRMKIPVVATHHNWIRGSWWTCGLEFLDGWLMRGFDRVAVVSASVGRTLKRFHVPAARVRIIPNGVDTVALGRPPDPAAVLREFGFASNARVVGAAGRLEAGKGFQRLIEAAPAILAAVPEACFLIAGDGPLKEHLKRRAAVLGLGGRLVLAGHRSDMPRIFNIMEVFVLASQNEGMPMVVLEAMASGVPVVASAVGGIAEVLRHEHSGILLTRSDAGTLAQSITRLLKQPQTAAALAECARNTVARRHALPVVAKQYEGLYREVLRARRVMIR